MITITESRRLHLYLVDTDIMPVREAEPEHIAAAGYVPMNDLADCAHQLNGALEARDAAVAHVRELEGQLLRALAPAAPAADSDTRRLPVVADCAVCRTKGYCPPDCTGHAPRPAALKGTDQ